jgi:hypothetical protein
MCEGRIQNSGVRRRTSGSISARPLYAEDKEKAKSATRPSDYFPDIDEWPNNWMRTKEDLEIGRGLLALFTPFIQHLIDEGLAKRTIKNHGNHLGALGGEIIGRLDGLNEEKNRTLSPRELILHYVHDEGGPLLFFLDPNDKADLVYHMAYDATCRKLLKFLRANRISSRDRNL